MARDRAAQHRVVDAHYGRAGLAGAVLAALRAAGLDRGTLTARDLAPLDQIHLGGRAATLALLRLAALPGGGRVLDIGGGIGGPARTLAEEAGHRVTVLDLTAAFCRVGALLTARTALRGRLAFVRGSALAPPFPAARFDACVGRLLHPGLTPGTHVSRV
jgi:SAM-dependent methyltransferase